MNLNLDILSDVLGGVDGYGEGEGEGEYAEGGGEGEYAEGGGEGEYAEGGGEGEGQTTQGSNTSIGGGSNEFKVLVKYEYTAERDNDLTIYIGMKI